MLPEMMKAVPKRYFPKGRPGRRPETRRPATVMTLGLLFIIIATGLLACSSGTGSSTSTGATGVGSSGVGWTVNVKIFSGTLSAGRGETTLVVVTVRDGAGTPAPKGTQINVSSTRGSVFATPVTAGSLTTENDIGQVMFIYTPARWFSIERTNEKGEIITKETLVPLSPGIDTVQASSMGAFGSATVQINS